MHRIKQALLIDDDDGANFIHTTLLKDTGYIKSIKAVLSAEEALDYLTCKGKYADLKEKPNPDLILVDINMSLMDGWEFLEEYHPLHVGFEDRRKILMISSSIWKEDKDKANNHPLINEFIVKPFNEEKIEAFFTKYFPAKG